MLLGHKKQIPFYNHRRQLHTWVIGQTGVGKSTALIRWCVDDIKNGFGVSFFDPHGDAIDEILKHIPKHRRDDVILFDPSDLDYPIGFNILDTIPERRRAFVASAVVDCFKAVWGYTNISTPQLDQFLFNGVRALLDVPDGTLMGLKFLLTSKRYRKKVLSHVQDPAIKDFWEVDFETHMPEREQRERTLSTLNKIGALITDPAVRNVIGQPRSAFILKDILDNNKILLVRLPQGQLGIEKASLIGALILSNLHLTALQRTNTNPFHVYIDECHHFGTSTLIEMLSGIRKFGITLVLAHQYVDQLPRELRSALIGTVGTLVSFRIGVLDAELLEPQFRLTNTDNHLYELPEFYASVSSGAGVTEFDMPEMVSQIYPTATERIRNRCRSEYAVPRQDIENRLKKFIQNT